MSDQKPARAVATRTRAGTTKTTRDATATAAAKPAARKSAWQASAPQGIDLQARIRQRAYELWECDGRPEGRDHAHWQQAEREVGATRTIG